MALNRRGFAKSLSGVVGAVLAGAVYPRIAGETTPVLAESREFEEAAR
jgi:hypothetical protein